MTPQQRRDMDLHLKLERHYHPIYWSRRPSFWERHKEALITLLIALAVLAVMWADIHLGAVGL